MSLWQPLFSFPTFPYTVSNAGDDLHWQEYNVPGEIPKENLSKLQEEINKTLSDDKGNAVGFTFQSHRSTVDGKTTSHTNFSVGKGAPWSPEEREGLEKRLVSAIGDKTNLNRIENVQKNVPVGKQIEGKKE